MKNVTTTISWILLFSFSVVLGISSGFAQDVPEEGGEEAPVEGEVTDPGPEPGEETEQPVEGEGETTDPGEETEQPVEGETTGSDIYAVEMDNGKELFFDLEGEHIHTALIDSEDGPPLAEDEIPASIRDWITETGMGEGAIVFKELSAEEDADSFVYLVDFADGLTAVFDSNGELINAHYYDDHDDHDGEGEHGEHPDGEYPDDGEPGDPTDPNYTGDPGDGQDGEHTDGGEPGEGETIVNEDIKSAVWGLGWNSVNHPSLTSTLHDWQQNVQQGDWEKIWGVKGSDGEPLEIKGTVRASDLKDISGIEYWGRIMTWNGTNGGDPSTVAYGLYYFNSDNTITYDSQSEHGTYVFREVSSAEINPNTNWPIYKITPDDANPAPLGSTWYLILWIDPSDRLQQMFVGVNKNNSHVIENEQAGLFPDICAPMDNPFTDATYNEVKFSEHIATNESIINRYKKFGGWASAEEQTAKAVAPGAEPETGDGGEHTDGGEPGDPTDPHYTGDPGDGQDGEYPDDHEPGHGEETDSGTDIFVVEMNNGVELFFNLEGEHIHTALVDSEDGPPLVDEEIPASIKDWISDTGRGEGALVFKEHSAEQGSDSFVYFVDLVDGLTAVFDNNGELINAHYDDDHEDHVDDEGESGEHPDGSEPDDPTDPNYTGGPGDGQDGEHPDGEYPDGGEPGDPTDPIYTGDPGDGHDGEYPGGEYPDGHEPGHGEDTDEGTDIYVVELDNGKKLFFNLEGEHIHTALIDAEDSPPLPGHEIPESIREWIADTGRGEGATVFKEHSAEQGSDSYVYIVDLTDGLTAIFDREAELIIAHYEDDGHHHGEGGPHDGEEPFVPWEPEEWKPFELPQVAGEHLAAQYPNVHFWAEEQEIEGAKQIVVYLDNGLEAYYDADGNHQRTIDPWEEKLKNVTPGLKLSTTSSTWTSADGSTSGAFTLDATTGIYSSSGGGTPAYGALQYDANTGAAESETAEPGEGEEVQEEEDDGAAPAGDDFHKGSMLYTLVFTNTQPGDSAPTAADGNLASTDLAAGTTLSLTFTYEFGPIRYIGLNGAELTSFTHSEPDWENDGSFTITVKTVNPPASTSDPDGTVIGSSFGMIVEMGGEYWYDGAIFMTDVFWNDMAQPKYTSPWEPVAAFNVAGKDGAAANFTAYLPINLIQGEFAVWRPQDLSAAVLKSDGSMSFIDGSTDDDGVPKIGSGWTLTPYQGERAGPGHPEGGSPGPEPEGGNPGPEPESGGGENYPLTESDARDLAEQLGLELGGAGTAFAGNYGTKGLYAYSSGDYEGMAFFGTGGTEEQMLAPIEHESKYRPSLGDLDNGGGPVELAASFIDFNGNGHKDPLLVVSFSNDSWSDADVQLGDPFLDPYANLDKSSFGTISGTVSAADGSFPPDYDVWLIEAVEGSSDPYEGKPAFMEYEPGDNGTYTIKVGPGTYYLEAVAFDFENDIPYKPRMHRDVSGNPLALTITDSSTVITGVNFSLKQEFRQTQGRGKVKGRIVNAGGEPVREANIEVFPVDDEGEILSDHPVGHGWVEANGSYTLEAPAGLMKLVISTWDNSFAAQESTITIPANGELTGQDFEMAARGAGTVSGSITDADDNPVWADVIFIDADDEDRFVWPKEFEMEKTDGEITGNYTATIPSGDYKVYAKRWDGSLLPAYYSSSAPTGASDFDEATTVTVGEGAASTGISIQLQARPTATMTFKVLNSADSTNVADAFVAFTDSEDEFGGVFFPHLEVSEDGTHTVKIPGGRYKVEIMADDYESAFYTVDESGDHAWEGTTWDDGATLTLTDGETTDVGSSSLTALTTTEEDNIKWLDFGDAPGAPTGATISGTVKTPEGDTVPRAQIIAHTDDYLLWLDHVQTKPDGTFTLKKLPKGNWVVFALPPFESESYRGYQESNEIALSLEDGDEVSDQALTLTSSNVSGRVMFSRKNSTGDRETVPLGHGFIWAFTDEDGDGNPDQVEEGEDEYVEEYVELNEDGFFTLNLGTTGSYTLYVELPPKHRASDPGAISFSVTNPDELLKLGNAVEISWSTQLSATGFSIERKASTSTSYKSLLSSDLSSSTRSYIDTSITPGETYVYRVTATLSSGNATLDDADVSQTDPFIYLAPSSKIISGTVVDADGNTVSGAEVFAAAKQGFIETTTDSSGAYELTAGPGVWEVNLRPARGSQATWTYEGFPEEIEFVEDATSESTTVNFEVAAVGSGKVTGTILKADGSSDWTGSTDYIEVNAFNPSGEGNFSTIGADGTFEILLPPGGYDVYVWINHEQFPTFKPPAMQHVRVANATVDLGNISLGAKSSKISGTLTDASGTALPNFFVAAWSKKTGDFISDTTNAAGQYELNVDSGAWEVMFEPPIPEGGAEIPYLMQDPRRVKVGGGATKTLDFTVAKAASSLEGTVVDSTGNPITDLDLFVYVRDASESAGRHDIVNEAEVDSRGKFTLNLSDGEYATGVWVPQGRGYRLDDEVTFTITGGEVTYGNAVTSLSLTLLSNDAVVSGTLSLSNSAVTGIKGDVFAVSAQGWEETSIQSDGTYSLTLGPGDWNIDYHIISDSDTSRTILPSPPSPTRVSAVAGSTVTQDFALKTAAATITGTILDETGTQLTDTTVYVWASRKGDPTHDDYETDVESTDGTFSLSVEAGGTYDVGAYLPPELREAGYLEPRAQSADISATGSATVTLTLEKTAEDNFIEGNIAAGESSIEGAYVYAWSDDGQFAEGETDADGNYKLLVPTGSTWHVGADFVNVDDEGAETVYITENELSVDLSAADSSSAQNIILAQPDFEVPDGAADTFDATKDFTTVLEDGTEIFIPANAIPVEADADGNTEVRFVVTPYTEGLVKNANDQPLDYGYQIELYDSDGKEISQEFDKAVTLTMAFDATELAADGINSENLNISFFNSTKNAWENADAASIDAEAGKIFASVTHFSSWANTATPDTTAPVITLTGDASVTISAGDTYTDAGATAADDTDGDISANITTGGTVDANAVGTYTLTYDVSDAAGNSAVQVTRSVIVQDTTAPIITLSGESTITFTVGGAYSEPGATATDNVDGDLTGSIVTAGDTVDPNAAGTYTVTFNVSDAAGNAATQVTRTVVVEAATGVADTTAPVITLIGDNPLVLAFEATYTDPGATATDNIDGVITGSISVGGDSVDTNVAGTYVVTYNVSDAAGNTATQVTRSVVVEEAPVNLLAGPLTGSTALASGWYISSWFGIFYYDTDQADGSWLYHRYLGWLYISSAEASDVWMWSDNANLGWLWTNTTYFTLTDTVDELAALNNSLVAAQAELAVAQNSKAPTGSRAGSLRGRQGIDAAIIQKATDKVAGLEEQIQNTLPSGLPRAYLYRKSDTRWIYYEANVDQSNWFYDFSSTEWASY